MTLDWLDKTPPQSLECEMAVVGCCLIETPAIECAVRMLKVSDFYREAHGIIFGAIAALHRQGVPVDLLSVQEKLRSKGLLEEAAGTPYLVTCMETVPCAVNIDHYCKIVKDKSLQRQWFEAFMGAAASMYCAENGFDAAFAEVKEIVREIEH